MGNNVSLECRNLVLRVRNILELIDIKLPVILCKVFDNKGSGDGFTYIIFSGKDLAKNCINDTLAREYDFNVYVYICGSFHNPSREKQVFLCIKIYGEMNVSWTNHDIIMVRNLY